MLAAPPYHAQEEVAALRQRDGERCLLHERIIAQQADLAAAAGEVEKLSEAVEAANVVIQVSCRAACGDPGRAKGVMLLLGAGI